MSAEFQGKYFGTLFQESSVSGHQQQKEFLSFDLFQDFFRQLENCQKVEKFTY